MRHKDLFLLRIHWIHVLLWTFFLKETFWKPKRSPYVTIFTLFSYFGGTMISQYKDLVMNQSRPWLPPRDSPNCACCSSLSISPSDIGRWAEIFVVSEKLILDKNPQNWHVPWKGTSLEREVLFQPSFLRAMSYSFRECIRFSLKHST